MMVDHSSFFFWLLSCCGVNLLREPAIAVPLNQL